MNASSLVKPESARAWAANSASAKASPQDSSRPRAVIEAGLGPLDQQRHSLPAAHAQRREPVAALHALQLGEQRDHDARAAAPSGVAEGDPAPVGVQALAVEVQL